MRPRPLRSLNRLLDRLGIRPLGLLVFIGSIVGLLALQGRQLSLIKARAVATATPIMHAAQLNGAVIEVHVKPGDVVAAGAPLVTVSSREIEQALQALDAEIALVEQQQQLALAQLDGDVRRRGLALGEKLIEAQRDLALAQADQSARRRESQSADALLAEVRAEVNAKRARVEARRDAQGDADRSRAAKRGADLRVVAEQGWRDAIQGLITSHPEASSLSLPTATSYAAQLELLRTRRRHRAEDLERRVITAHSAGRVVQVLPQGSAVTLGVVVAQLLPEQATEIIAYLPSETRSDLLSPGAEVAIISPAGLCGDRRGSLLRVGADVQQAPGQLDSILRRPTFGMPVYISVPEGCQLGVGQTLSVEITR